MHDFNFVEKGLEIMSALHFVYDLSGKMFLVLYSDQISLPNCLDVGQYVYYNC